MALMSISLTLASALLLVVGLRRSRRDMVIEERLAQFGHRVPTLEELELQLPFSERVLLPLLERIASLAARLTPQANLQRLQQRLVEAGSPGNLRATTFVGVRLVAALFLGAVFLVLFLPSTANPAYKLGLPVLTALIGFLLPNIWLGRRIAARKREITRALPDAIDLLSISVEAGLGFDQALSRVVEKWDNALTREFGRMLSETRMGKSRRQAMRELAERVNVDDLNVFIASLIQADQLGVSITQVLRAQSQQMRQRRRQRAEELAHKAPIKMLFPMIFLIFPALYIVILGPALPRIVEVFR
jgi:tight adherence protein C